MHVYKNKQSKRFSTELCKFYWINKTDWFIVACSYVGNQHGTIQKPKMGVLGYDVFIVYKRMYRKLTSKLPMNGPLTGHARLLSTAKA